MHQCPQMAAQSQNTDSKGLRVISHTIFFWREVQVDFSEKKKKEHTGVAKVVLYLSRALISCKDLLLPLE